MAGNDYLESEIKLYVPDLEQVKEKLESLGAERLAARVYERNVRYDNSDYTLTADDIVLRLRQDTKARLTYKESLDQRDTNVNTRFEAEVEVSDFQAMEVILERLGYFPYVIYEKFRATYELYGAEVVLDEMPYGDFVEIEGEPDVVMRVVNALALQDMPNFRANYLTLFDRVRENLNLDVQNLTFDSFADVQVPLDAFEGQDEE